MRFDAIEFDNAHEAVQHTYAAGCGEAIRLDGKCLVVGKDDAHRLEADGIALAYLADHEMPDGTHRIVTIPVND